MTLKELEIFLELSENQNVIKTAQKLSVTQSAVSQSIKSLENKLGETLFDRIGKKLILNERGRKFREMTLNPYNELISAKHSFLKEKIAGTLSISASKTIGTYLLPQIIFNYLSSNNNVKIKKEIHNSSIIINNIMEGKIDLGFIETECENNNIIKEKIKEDELIIVSKTPQKEVFIDELKHKKWILRETGSGTREMFLKQIKNIIDIEIFMEFNEFEEAKTILLNNPETLTCVSKEVVKKELKEKKLFEIKIKNITFKRNFYLVYHKNKIKTELFDDFVKYIKKETNPKIR
ncbi:transcriptional regulator [Nautilia profundicola AmH]|uniref:Transcriptional regulator n=1 Tax=Nautilia profundicola (strain ATCC BAA-1463 / DSM 18972 / AmH) TaxID=598659 RepID=B9L957_NAUPA|nr:LysR substrate-binding domain-containing protein [Nautilia profundicola]ACM92331.1 transcriptional regulator [Nautilia profundicola AmH]